MARVPYLDKPDVAAEHHDLLARNINLYRALVHSPNGARSFQELGLFIRHFDAEFFFQRHDQLDGVERIRAEIFDKLGCRDDLFRLYTELFDDDILYTLVNRFV